jgi:hypothetical protein
MRRTFLMILATKIDPLKSAKILDCLIRPGWVCGEFVAHPQPNCGLKIAVRGRLGRVSTTPAKASEVSEDGCKPSPLRQRRRFKALTIAALPPLTDIREYHAEVSAPETSEKSIVYFGNEPLTVADLLAAPVIVW